MEGVWSEFLRFPRIFTAISLVISKYSKPIMRGSLGFISSYSKVPSSRFTFFILFLWLRSSIILRNSLRFSSSMRGKQRSFTVSSMNLFIFSFFSSAVFLSSTFLSMQFVLMSQLDLYLDCIYSCCISIIRSYSSNRSLRCLYFQVLRSSYFFSWSSRALLSTASNIECLSLIAFFLLSIQVCSYLLQQLCSSFLKRGGCCAKLLDINLQSLSRCSLSIFYFSRFSSLCLTFLSSSSFFSFASFSLSCFSSCYFLSWSSSSFFLCCSSRPLLSSFSIFCFFMNYSYYLIFSYLISKGLKRDSVLAGWLPLIYSMLSFISNSFLWISDDWSRSMLIFFCLSSSSVSNALLL